MFHFFYYFEYTATNFEKDSPIAFDAKVYAFADKYFVEPLKELAAQNFTEAARTQWNTDAFADAISAVQDIEGANGGILKATAMAIVQEHVVELLTQSGSVRFNEVLREVPGFAAEVLTAYVAVTRQRHELKAWYKCPGSYYQSKGLKFAISEDFPVEAHLSCPAGCYQGHCLTWWAKYKVEDRVKEPADETCRTQ